jgi:hypothetical protein
MGTRDSLARMPMHVSSTMDPPVFYVLSDAANIPFVLLLVKYCILRQSALL